MLREENDSLESDIRDIAMKLRNEEDYRAELLESHASIQEDLKKKSQKLKEKL